MNSGEDKRKTTYRYGLASACSRLFSKLFDLILIFLILIGVFYWIFNNEMIWINENVITSTIPSWKIFVFALVTCLLFFIYFIIIPFFFGGYTLFSKIFKIRIYSIYLKTFVNRKWLKNLDFRFFKQLLVRELFLWEINVIVFLLLGIFSFALSQETSDFIKALINFEVNPLSEVNIVTILFSTIFSVSSLITLFIIVNVIFTSKKRSFHDSISNTVVIKMTDVHSDEKRPSLSVKGNKSKVHYSFPGEVPIDSLLDIIEDN